MAYTIHDKTKDVVLGYVGTRENFYNELQQKAIKSKRFVLEEQQTDQNQKSTDKQPKPTKKKPPKNRQKNQGKSKRFAPDLGNSELVTNNFYDIIGNTYGQEIVEQIKLADQQKFSNNISAKAVENNFYDIIKYNYGNRAAKQLKSADQKKSKKPPLPSQQDFNTGFADLVQQNTKQRTK